MSDIEAKYFATCDYNKFNKEMLDAKINKKELRNKTNISNFVKNPDLNKKIATLPTKAELKAEQDKIVNLKAFDSSYFGNNSHFEDDDTQNYLVF